MRGVLLTIKVEATSTHNHSYITHISYAATDFNIFEREPYNFSIYTKRYFVRYLCACVGVERENIFSSIF